MNGDGRDDVVFEHLGGAAAAMLAHANGAPSDATRIGTIGQDRNLMAQRAGRVPGSGTPLCREARRVRECVAQPSDLIQAEVATGASMPP